MINYSKRLGENMFDRLFPTSPGRVDPSTGMFVTTTNIPVDELRRIASRREDRGYEPRRSEGWPPSEGGFRGRGEYEGLRRAGISGPYLVEGTGLLQNPALWLILGTGILIALETSGVTHLSPKA